MIGTKINTANTPSANTIPGKGSGFSSFLIGESSLLIRCAEILQRYNCKIEGIISTNSKNHHWATKQKIPFYHADDDLTALMSIKQFDYIFSIASSYIVTPEFLSLPQKLAIEYHDSLLPRYAGAYATAWAIINQEKTHGVSWGVMSADDATGDILKQGSVKIDQTETSLSLNAKCYEKAIETFSSLVGDFLTGRITFIRQDLTARTYYELYMRPKSACIISFDQDASNIDAFVRGLTFGETYPNKLGTPKLVINGNYFILREVRQLTSTSNKKAGTILKVSETSLTISTTTYDISIERIEHLDGSSILIRELANKYSLEEGYVLEKTDPKLDIRLTKYYAETSRYEAYWTNKLMKYVPVTIPYAKQTLSERSKDSTNTLPFIIPREFVSFLNKNNHRKDIYESVLSAFAAYLGRLSGLTSFSIGFKPMDIHNWPSEIFCHYIPLGVDSDFACSFLVFRTDMQNELVKSIKNKTFTRDMPTRYPELKALSSVKDSLSPIISVSIVENLEDYQNNNNFGLEVVISKITGKCLWAYNPSFLSEANVSRMMSQLSCFMRSIANTPEEPIQSLALMTDDELHEILVKWNCSQTYYPENICIHELFEEWAAKTPDEIAVVCGINSVTYQELNHKANLLANELINQGVGPDVLVGLCLERTITYIIGLLGVLKAGGAYVPIDADYPKNRIFFMIEDSSMLILVTQKKLAQSFSELHMPLICLDTDFLDVPEKPANNPSTNVTKRNLAYLMYTSGTSGKPKGVMITHGNVVAFLYSYKEVTQDGEKRIGTSVAPFSFDTSVEEIYATVCFGGTLHIIDPQKSADVEYFANYLVDHKITTTYIVPDFLEGIAKELEKKRNHNNIKCLITGLAPKKERTLQCFRDLSKSIKILNAYGPTEVTYGATAYYFKHTRNPERFVPIGVPFPNYDVYIVDSHLQPVPIGVSGELLIGGIGLAKGYFNRPALTDEKFIPHPFTKEKGTKLYRTGDLVRFLPDGNIEFIGRIDRQVKIRGYRIELGEIENVLEKHDSIKKAVVITRADKSENQRIIAYFVCEQHPEPTVTELRDFLKQELPDYMLPAAFMRLEALPLLPNGKLDYHSLPATGNVRPHLESHFVPPRNPEEEKLATIMTKVLGMSKIGIYDDFFELGGDSLAAVQMAVEIEQAFNKKVPLSILVQATTIELLSRVLSSKQLLEQSWEILVELNPGDSRVPFFCIHSEGGDILEYYELSKYLGVDQPFYGFQPLGMSGEKVEPVSIENMATQYIKAMKQKQPTGPYYIGGYCLGGMISFEMARQLESEGEKIAFIGIISTTTPEYLQNYKEGITFSQKLYYKLSERMKLELNNLSTLGAKDRTRYFKYKARQVLDMFWVRIEAVIWRLFNLHNVNKAMHSRVYNMHKLGSFQNAAFFEYRFRPIKSKITVFRPSNLYLALKDDPTLGFRNLSETGTEDYEIDCFHKNILKYPNVKNLAGAYRDCLNKAQAAEESAP